jgi:hypothetical protein
MVWVPVVWVSSLQLVRVFGVVLMAKVLVVVGDQAKLVATAIAPEQ